MSDPAVSPLVSAAWLGDHLADPGLRVLDATAEFAFDGETGAVAIVSGRATWEAGHIPGSAFADLKELSDPARSGEFMVPPAQQFEAAMSELGVGGENHVVVYDSGVTMFATRLWWMLRLFGLDTVSVLDGGFAAWKQEGRPVSTRPGGYPRADFRACLRPHLLATVEDIEADVRNGGGCHVNALSPEMFRGESAVGYSRPGRIPGSVNVPYYGLLRPDGRWLEPAQLRERLADAGVLDARDRVVAYCGGGLGATVVAFGFALSGRQDVAVYDGSLKEWTADPVRPLETG